MALTDFVPHTPYEEYRDRFAQHVALSRDNGVLTARMHTNDGPVLYSLEFHAALPQVLHEIGRDPENKVVILTGTGPTWIMDFDQSASVVQGYSGMSTGDFLDQLYRD